MKIIIKNTIAIIIGWLGGSAINMGLIQIGNTIFPIDGVIGNNIDSLTAILPSLKFEYFIFPFLAHAIGTLIGATIAGWIAVSHKMKFSLTIGCLFLIGGIYMNSILPGPIWFSVADLLIAYIPMAWIGGKIAQSV